MMKKKFQREYTIKGIICFLLSRWKIVVILALVMGILGCVFAKVYNSKSAIDNAESNGYVLENNNYVYSSVLLITPKSDNTRDIDMNTFLGVLISPAVINNTIEEMKLSESYLSLLGKFEYSCLGNTIKFEIQTPESDAGGYSWNEVMLSIINNLQNEINEYFPDYQFEILDQPKILNKEVEVGGIGENRQTTSNDYVKYALLFMMISVIILCAIFACEYLLNDKIYAAEEIENNLEIPVLAEIKMRAKDVKLNDLEGIKRVANEIARQEKKKAIAIVSIQTDLVAGESEMLVSQLNDRGEKASLVKEEDLCKLDIGKNKKEGVLIVETKPLIASADAVMIAKQCDGAIIVVKNGKVSGRSAICTKRELDRHNVNCLGAIFVK